MMLTRRCRLALLLCCLWGAVTLSAAERLVNGTVTTDFPNVGKLVINDFGFCTGTLIAPTVVLSASHCFRDGLEPGMGFAIGGRVIPITGVILHPAFRHEDEADFDLYNTNDVAILTLAEAVTDITPAIINFSPPTIGTELTVVGFGRYGTYEEGMLGTDGQKRFGHYLIDDLDPWFVISHFDQPDESNMAPGDSGGPSFIEVGDELQVMAITSWSTDANRKHGDMPHNARVDVAQDFITRAMAAAEIRAQVSTVYAWQRQETLIADGKRRRITHQGYLVLDELSGGAVVLEVGPQDGLRILQFDRFLEADRWVFSPRLATGTSAALLVSVAPGVGNPGLTGILLASGSASKTTDTAPNALSGLAMAFDESTGRLSTSTVALRRQANQTKRLRYQSALPAALNLRSKLRFDFEGAGFAFRPSANIIKEPEPLCPALYGFRTVAETPVGRVRVAGRIVLDLANSQATLLWRYGSSSGLAPVTLNLPAADGLISGLGRQDHATGSQVFAFFGTAGDAPGEISAWQVTGSSKTLAKAAGRCVQALPGSLSLGSLMLNSDASSYLRGTAKLDKRTLKTGKTAAELLAQAEAELAATILK
jgi:hypothetical protein